MPAAGMEGTMDTTTPSPHDLISRPEAGRMLGTGPKGIDGLIARGELRAWRIGERVKLSKKEVLAYRLGAQGWVPAAEYTHPSR
jgi:excisionase family DNA binding protein